MQPLTPPPPDAIVLFNGRDLDNWTSRKRGPAGWRVADGAMTVVARAGDIMTRDRFIDFYLHLEFRIPAMPEARGQAKGNSGVYLQGRYEIQVLDSHGINVPGKGDCGAVYNQHAPLVNACKPALEWQTYDAIFRAARDGEPARLTLFQNGRVIHNNVVLAEPTGGALDSEVTAAGPLLLQDHGNDVQYRNIWLVPLPLAGSDRYEPG